MRNTGRAEIMGAGTYKAVTPAGTQRHGVDDLVEVRGCTHEPLVDSSVSILST